MSFYLETNTLETRANKLIEIVKYFNNDVYTSSLAFMELISGMTTEEYQLRKNIMQKVVDSKIAVDWRVPMECFVNAFGIIGFASKKAEQLRKTIEIVLGSQTLDAAINKTESDSTAWSMEDLLQLDDNISGPTKKTLSEKIKEYAQADRDAEKSILHIWKKRADERTSEEKQELQIFMHEAVEQQRYLQARDVCRACKIGLTQEAIDELIKRYDFSLDHYLVGQAFFQIEKLLTISEMSENDTYDITHLVYLRGDEVNRIVSNDKIFDKVFRNYEKKPNIKIAEFDNMYGVKT